MSDFSKAIRAGIQSAQDADRDIREINAAIHELVNAVEQVSEGVVTVIRENAMDISSLASVVSGGLLTAKGNWITAISFKRKLAPKSKTEIARINIPSSGYPCEVRYGNVKQSCYDRPSLVTVLEELLSSPDVGRALIGLMNMKAEEKGQGVDSDDPS